MNLSIITLMLNIHFSLPLPIAQKLLNTETYTNNTPSPRLKLIHFHQSVSKWKIPLYYKSAEKPKIHIG